jgi:hypothetical protein
MKQKIFFQQIMVVVFSVYFLHASSSAQIRIVNMVPQLQSNQTANDVEPNIAVNPANKLQIAGTAFTPDPMGGANAPIYISTDGGNNWALNSILPGNDPTFGTGDVTARFAGSGNQLYVGTLRGGAGLTLNILRVPNYTSPTVAQLMVSRASVDQPYVQASTLLGGAGATNDRVYIATNDRVASPLSAAANLSLDAFSAPAPGGFATNLFPNRPTTSRVMPGVRPTIHPSGIVYMAFYNVTPTGSDVVVARDDNWGLGATPFRNLVDAGDALPGQRVVTGRTLPAFGVNLGNSRLVASNISIAVDPVNAATVYVSWADRVGTTDYTLHVRRSTNSGQTWSGDLLTITNATNPALAVNSAGKTGYLYQQLTGTGAARRWETHLRRSINSGTTWDDVILHTALMSDPGPWLGDYVHLMAVGKDFYGIFSGSNFPDNTNFPQGVTYLRNANFTTHQLLGTNGTSVIGGSMDPFFFQATEITDVNDFFVRDFTNSATDFDPGLEPSTYPWFYINSDVWNKRTNAAGSFNGNNQPESEDPWQTTDGHNYAFARLHRKTAGAAQNVNVHYLISEFGTGSNFVNANTTADPVVSFGAADLEVIQATGYEWELPVTSSIHTCMAVEISTAADPVIQPSLLNHTPGWSNGTDLMVLNDNNKAQRNMEVYHVPAGGGAVSSYAAIHNPGLYKSDMKINWKKDLYPRIRIKPSVASVSGRENTKIGQDDITLLNMKPGETRFIRISYSIGAAAQGSVVPLVFNEIKNGPVINGFTSARQIDKIENVVAQNVKYEALIFRRISKLFRSADAESIRKTDIEFIEKNNFSDNRFIELYRQNFPAFKNAVAELLKNDQTDPFKIIDGWNDTEAALRNGNIAEMLTSHLSMLNAIDAFVTVLQLKKGNAADYLQTIYIQKALVEKFKSKNPGADVDELLKRSNDFIEAAGNRKINFLDYPEAIKNMLRGLTIITKNINTNDELRAALKLMERNFDDGVALQKEHLNFLNLFAEKIK